MSQSTLLDPNTGNPNPALGVDKHGAELTTGTLYQGIIDAVDPAKKVYTVYCYRTGDTVPNCLYGTGIAAALSGVRGNLILTPGTQVLFCYDNPSVIVCTLPSEDADESAGANRTLTHAEDGLDIEVGEAGSGLNYQGATMARDFYPGEYEIGNQLGLALQFLTTMVKLQAGERAKVECHMYEDLVRIVSDSFKHYTCFGDLTIENAGGGPTLVWNGASKTAESWGQVNSEDAKVADGVDGNTVAKDQVAAEGRWRMSTYMGYLGDFLHLLVTDPEKTIGQLAQKRAGKFDMHINNDGSFILRSVGDIALERVSVIPVPIQLLPSEDKEGNTRVEIEEMVVRQGSRLDTLLTRWDYGVTEDRLHLLPYQLREYSRYLSQFHAYARMLAQDKDWQIPSEAEAYEESPPTWNNNEEDVERANSGDVDYFPVYSTIRILRDGSQLHQDGYGNAILMSKDGVQISSGKDLLFEAAGNIHVRAGQNVFVTARRHVEINAVVGQMILKARTFFQALCEWGSMHLRSDAPDLKDPNIADLRRAREDQPLPDEDPEPIVLEHALILEGSIGNTLVRSSRRTTIESTGQNLDESELSDLEDTHGSVVIQSKMQDVLTHAGRNTWMHAVGDADTEFTGVVGLRGDRALAFQAGPDGTQFRTAGIFDINQALTVRQKGVVIPSLRVNTLAASLNIYGPRKGPTEGRVGSHFNHISQFDDAPANLQELTRAEVAEVAVSAHQRARPSGAYTIQLEPLRWNYMPLAEYEPQGIVAEEGLAWRSITQEQLLDDPVFVDQDLLAWDSRLNRLNSACALTGDKNPDPCYGGDVPWRFYTHTEPCLSQPTTTAAADLSTPPEATTGARIMQIRPRL